MGSYILRDIPKIGRNNTNRKILNVFRVSVTCNYVYFETNNSVIITMQSLRHRRLILLKNILVDNTIISMI